MEYRTKLDGDKKIEKEKKIPVFLISSRSRFLRRISYDEIDRSVSEKLLFDK